EQAPPPRPAEADAAACRRAQVPPCRARHGKTSSIPCPNHPYAPPAGTEDHVRGVRAGVKEETKALTGFLAAALGATAALLAWAPLARVNIEGGFEGERRDL